MSRGCRGPACAGHDSGRFSKKIQPRISDTGRDEGREQLRPDNTGCVDLLHARRQGGANGMIARSGPPGRARQAALCGARVGCVSPWPHHIAKHYGVTRDISRLRQVGYGPDTPKATPRGQGHTGDPTRRSTSSTCTRRVSVTPRATYSPTIPRKSNWIPDSNHIEIVMVAKPWGNLSGSARDQIR